VSEAYENVIDLYTRGHTAEEIERASGLTRSTVHSYLFKAQRAGRLRLRAKGRPVAVMKLLPPEVRQWLWSITPAGATVEDTMKAIIIDTYEEEKK